MTSTNDGKEVKSNQTSSQKGKSYLIEIYKSLDSRLSGDCSGLERTQCVCEAWRRIYSLCSHSAPSTHPHLLSWLQRHTATTVLQTEWTNCQDQHALLTEAIDEFIQDCTTSISKRNGSSKPWELQLRIRAEWFKRILPNPWGHPVLKALLDSDQTPSDQEILEWLKEERGVMFVTRLRQMAALKSCADLALRLTAAVMSRARINDPQLPDVDQIDTHKEPTEPIKVGTFTAILRKEAGFTTDVWQFLTDLEFVLLHKTTQRSCIDLAKQVPFRDACPLVKRLQSRPVISPKEKKLWKNAKEVALLIAQVVIARCMVVPSCRGAVLDALYGCSRSIARLMTDAQLSAASVALAAPAASAHHLHTMAAAVHKQLKGERTQFVCQLYVRAITAGMNELEQLKLNKEKSAEARSTEQTLSTWFKDLGSLLSKSNRLRYECVLTAFSVHPSPDMYDEVKGASVLEPIKDVQEPNPETTTEFGSWATDSRTQTNLVKTSETLNLKKTQKQANVLSTAIFSEGDALGLEPELCNDLAVLLSGPRVKTLTWDMEREALLENCRTYMKRTDFGTRALTTELKYLNLDPSSFQHLPEEDDNEDDVYYGIEKGYEHLVELQEPISDTMPPEIWQEAFYESPSLSSDDSVNVVKRRKKKKKIPVVVATLAEDPLKLDADIDINTKTEEPNIMPRKETELVSKECSQDINQCNDGTQVKHKTKKEKKKERKKEKKEAKQRKKTSKIDTGQEIEEVTNNKERKNKKDASSGALTKLLGMKVARKNSELRNLIKNTERMMFPTRPLENKDKKVCNTQVTSNVIFDGLFSMDETSFPDLQNKGKNLNNKEERECITQAVTKHDPPPLTPIRHDIYKQIKTKIVNEIKDDVKSSIKQLIDFRRHKVERTNTIKSTQNADTTDPKRADVASKTGISHRHAPKHDFSQKQNQKDDRIFKGCNYPPTGGYSITKLHNQIQNYGTSSAIIKNIKESPSQKAYEEFLMLRSYQAVNLLNTIPISQPSQISCQKQYQSFEDVNLLNTTPIPQPSQMSCQQQSQSFEDVHLLNTTSIPQPSQMSCQQQSQSFEAVHLLNTTPIPQPLQMSCQQQSQSLDDMNLLNTNPIPQPSKTCQKQSQDLSKEYYNNPSLLTNELKHSDITLSSSDKSLYTPEETSQNKLKKSCELSKTPCRPVNSPISYDPTQKSYQDFLKELQESINPGTMYKQKPEVKHVDISVGTKTLKAPKLAENAPNTFSRLSYLHKSKQLENKLKIEEENKARAAASRVPKDLNSMLPIHLQNRGEIKISRIRKKPSGTDPTPLRNHKKSEPTTSRLAQSHRNLVQALQLKPNITKNITNMTSKELKNKIHNQIISKTESSINTKLSEKDQTELLQLLRQQSRLNATNVATLVQSRLDPRDSPVGFGKISTTKDAITVLSTTTEVNATSHQNQQKNLTKTVLPPKNIEALDTKDRLQPNTEKIKCIKTPNAATPKYIQFKILKDNEQEVFEIKDMNLAQSCNVLEPKFKEINQIKSENEPSVIVDHSIKYGNSVPHKQPTNISTLSKERNNIKTLLCDEKLPEEFVNNKELLKDKLEPRLNVIPEQSKSINVSEVKKKTAPKKPLITRKIKESNTETSDKASWESVFNDLLKHKTPSRGPNALDVALKKDTFKHHVLQTNQKSDNQSMPTNKRSNKHERKITVDLENRVTKSIEKTTDAKQFIEFQPKEEDPFISGIPNSDYDLLDELMDDDLRQEIRELSDDEAYCPMDLYTPKEKDNITGPGIVIEKPIPKSTPYLNVGINEQTKIKNSNPKSVIVKHPQKSSNSVASDGRTRILSSELPVNSAKLSKNISNKKAKAKPHTSKVILKPQPFKKQIKKDEIDTSIDKSKSENSAAAPSTVTISNNVTKLPKNTNSAAVHPSALLLKVPGNTDLPETSSLVSPSNNSAKLFNNMRCAAPSVSLSKDTTKVSQNSVVTCSSVSLPNNSTKVSQNTILAAAPSSIALLSHTKASRNTHFVAPGNVIIKPTPKPKGTQNIVLLGSDIAYGLLTPINQSLFRQIETSTADTNSYSSQNISLVNPTSLTNLVKPVVISNVSLNLTPISTATNAVTIKRTEVNVEKHGESVAMDLQNIRHDQDSINKTVIVSSAQSNEVSEPELIEGKITKNINNIHLDAVVPNQSTSNNSLSETSMQRCSVIRNKFSTENTGQHNERKVLSELQEKLTQTPGEKSVIKKYCPFKNNCLIENDIMSKKNAERLKNKRFSILNRQIKHYSSREPIPLTYTSLSQIETTNANVIKEKLNMAAPIAETCHSLKIENIKSKHTQNIKTALEKRGCVDEEKSESCVLKTNIKSSKNDIESPDTSLVNARNINEKTPTSSIKSSIPFNKDIRNEATDILNKYKVVEPNDTLVYNRETGIEKMSSKENMSSQNTEHKVTMKSAAKVSNEVGAKKSKYGVNSIDINESGELKSNETPFHQRSKCNDNYYNGNNICQNKQALNSNVNNLNNDKSVLDMYRDRIHFEEIPKKSTDDPMKRIVRIKLPNGTVFKATISGKLDINIDSVFSDPQMKSILLNNVSKTKKCTVNIKQMTIPDNTNATEKTIVNKIQYPNNISNESETINLVSDDECDEIDKDNFKTEFGEFTVSFKDRDAYTKHQKRLSDKCTVPVEKSTIIDKINAAKACLRLKSHASSDVLSNNAGDNNNEKNASVIEIDDSSDDSIFESLIPHVPQRRVLKPKLSTDIDLLRKSIIKGLKISNIHEDSNNTKSQIITEISSITNICSKNMLRSPINEGIDMVDLTNKQKKIRNMMKNCHVKLIRCDDSSKLSLNSASKGEKPSRDGVEGQVFKNDSASLNSSLSINEFNNKKEHNHCFSKKLSQSGTELPINNIVPYISGDTGQTLSKRKHNVEYDDHVSTTSELSINNDKICADEDMSTMSQELNNEQNKEVVRTVTSFDEESRDMIDTEKERDISLVVHELSMIVNKVSPAKYDMPEQRNDTNDVRYEHKKSLNSFKENGVQKATFSGNEEFPIIDVNVLQEEIDGPKLKEYEEQKNGSNNIFIKTNEETMRVDSGIIDQVRCEFKECQERNHIPSITLEPLNEPLIYTNPDRLAANDEISSNKDKVQMYASIMPILAGKLLEAKKWKKGIDKPVNEIISINKPKACEKQSDASSGTDPENVDTGLLSGHVTDKMKQFREGIDLSPIVKEPSVPNSDECGVEQDLNEKLLISKENENEVHSSTGELLLNEFDQRFRADFSSVTDNLSKDELQKYEEPCIIPWNEDKEQVKGNIVSVLSKELLLNDVDECEEGNYEPSMSERLSKNHDFRVLNEKISINEDNIQERKNMPSPSVESLLSDISQCINRELSAVEIKEHEELKDISIQNYDISLSGDSLRQEKDENMSSSNKEPFLNETKDSKERNHMLIVNNELCFEKQNEKQLYEGDSQKEDVFSVDKEMSIIKEFQIFKEGRSKELLFTHDDSQKGKDVCSANKVSLVSDPEQYEEDLLTCTVVSSPVSERRDSFSILIDYSTDIEARQNVIDQKSNKSFCECFADWYLTKPSIHHHDNMTVENSDSLQIRYDNAYLHNNVSTDPEIGVTSMTNMLKNNKKAINICNSDWYCTKPLIHFDSINSNLIFKKPIQIENFIKSTSLEDVSDLDNTLKLNKIVRPRYVLSLSTIMAEYFAENTIINFLKPTWQSRKRKIVVSDSSLSHRKHMKHSSVLRKLKYIDSDCQKNDIMQNCDSTLKQENNFNITDTNKKENIPNHDKIIFGQIALRADHDNYKNFSNFENISQSDEEDQSRIFSGTVKQLVILDKTFIQDFIHREKVNSETILNVGILKADTKDKLNLIDSDSVRVDVTKLDSFCIKNDLNDRNHSIIIATDKEKKVIKDVTAESREVTYISQDNDLNCERLVMTDGNVSIFAPHQKGIEEDFLKAQKTSEDVHEFQDLNKINIATDSKITSHNVQRTSISDRVIDSGEAIKDYVIETLEISDLKEECEMNAIKLNSKNEIKSDVIEPRDFLLNNTQEISNHINKDIRIQYDGESQVMLSAAKEIIKNNSNKLLSDMEIKTKNCITDIKETSQTVHGMSNCYNKLLVQYEVKDENGSEPEVISQNTHKYANRKSKIEDGIIINNDSESKVVVSEDLIDKKNVFISKNLKGSDEIEVKIADDTIDCQERPKKYSDDHKDNEIVDNITLLYKGNSDLILKGSVFKDPVVGTCYLFPIRSFVGKDCKSLPKEDILISEEMKFNDSGDSFHVMIPKITYSKQKCKFTDNRLYTHTKRNLKRKSDTSNSKYYSQKRYRNGKNIDYPKIHVTAIKDSAYVKEFKALYDYWDSIKFSFSRPFHKENFDVNKLLKSWPIQGEVNFLKVMKDKSIDENVLFLSNNDENRIEYDPLHQTLADELASGVQENKYQSIEINENNFSMGFGEGSDRVIQHYVDRKTHQKISAATLSDVKPAQPFSIFKCCHSETVNNNTNDKIYTNEDQIDVTKRFITYIGLKNKVRSFFKRTTLELNHDWIFNNMKESDKNCKHQFLDNPFDMDHLDFFRVPSLETIVQVVQVGQLPVSAAAQNPVSCDPRVTQVTDASPPQCSAENSPRDGSQPMKTEYTELTTADLSFPLDEEYERHNNQTMNLLSQDNNKMTFSDENIPIETEVNSIVKIEVLDDDEQNDVNHVNDRDYCFDTNDSNATTESQTLSFQNLNDTDSFIQNEEYHDKSDQIGHAMNAAGITNNAEPLSTNETQSIGDVIGDKSNEDHNTPQTPSNNYSKTTSINAIALQQALSQILPPPLNSNNTSDNNQQTSNNPQVLHIVQGKNSSVNQLTLVDNTQQSVINASNSTPVLHIVQNKGQQHSISSTSTSQPANSFNGLSLVDSSNMAQGGSQLLHIVNASGQKTNNTGQLLKRVNLLTNLSNVQGGNEQKMVQFVCKSADGKSIQLNAPHQRSMVLRLQPIESPNVLNNSTKTSDSHNDLNINGNITSANNNNSNESTNNQQEIKSRSVYEENYAKFIQNSGKPAIIEKSTSLPKFNQAFGKQVFQDDNQKANELTENHSHLTSGNSVNNNSECQIENSINMDQMGHINNQTLLLRKSTAPPTSQSQPPQPNLVQQLKQTIAPINLQTMHGGVIYTRQIPVNIGGGQTINLITVPSTELLDDSNQKHVNQSDIEPSIIKIVSQNQTTNSEVSTEESRNQASSDCTTNTQPPPVLTQMRIKLPMLSKPSQIVSGTRVVRPSFFQIQRNVIGGANQPVYQQLVLTAAPPLGQQTIRLPQSQTNRLIKVSSENQTSSESHMSSSTLEQLREFDMVLEQVKERSTVQPNPSTNNNAYNNNSKVYTSSTDTMDTSSHSTASTQSTHQVLYTIGNNSSLNVAYVNRKTSVTTPILSTYVRSPDSSNVNDSPSSSSQNHIQHSSTSEAHANELSSPQNQHKQKITTKSKSKPKPTLHPSSTVKFNTVPPKPSTQKPFEDEQTTQRILYILAEYKEQVENSPDKDKPAPRRRSNPPSNPGSSKRKKSSSSSRRSGTRDMSPVHGEDTCRTMGSEDSSCGTSQGDCNESCLDSHSPQDSPRKVMRKLTFEPETPAAQPRPQPQRNVIVADGQTITVSRNNTTKPTTAVLMPANYILPVSMVKSGQQIAIVTNRGPKILTVGGGEGGGNAVLLQRLIGPGLKPVLTRPGVRHVRLPAAALHNLQAFTLGSAASQQPDSTAPAVNPNPPELIDTRATALPWADREGQDAKPEKQSSPESTEPWNIASSNDLHDYSYEEIVRSDNMDRTVLDAIPDRYSPDMEAQRIFDKMFDIDSKRSYIVDSQDDSPRCGYDIDASDCDDRPYHQVVHRKDGTTQRHHRLTHVSSAALRHRYAILEHEVRLQKSLSEECEDLGVDSPSASELFPEAELLFSSSPAHEATHHSHTPQPIISQSSIPQPDMDDQIATDHLISHHDVPDDEDLLGLDNIVTVSGDGTITLDPQEFARSHPNTTFHREPTDESELQPFTIANVKGRHMTSTIFHASRAPATVLVTAPQTTVISQATPDGGVHGKYHDPPAHSHGAPTVLVKDNGVSKFDTMLNRELHLSNTASTIIHGATQVIRRVCYDEDKNDPRFLASHALIGHDAKMTEDSRGVTLESMADDDDRLSPERNDMFWESNSMSEGRRPLDFSSDSDKCCKSPFEENNSTDSSGIGTHIMRLDSVIKDARGIERRGSADGSSADDTHPPLRTYPPKRYLPPDTEERSTSGKTRAGERSPDVTESRRRASNRGVVKRGCHCCNGSPAPPKTKKSRPRKPNAEFTT